MKTRHMNKGKHMTGSHDGIRESHDKTRNMTMRQLQNKRNENMDMNAKPKTKRDTDNTYPILTDSDK
jgi:hypothetical protein